MCSWRLSLLNALTPLTFRSQKLVHLILIDHSVDRVFCRTARITRTKSICRIGWAAPELDRDYSTLTGMPARHVIPPVPPSVVQIDFLKPVPVPRKSAFWDRCPRDIKDGPGREKSDCVRVWPHRYLCPDGGQTQRSGVSNWCGH